MAFHCSQTWFDVGSSYTVCKLEGWKPVFVLMACLGAAVHGKAQTCTANAVIEQQGQPDELNLLKLQINVVVNDPVLGDGVLVGTSRNEYALTLATQPGNRQQHWFAASADDDSRYDKQFKAETAYWADNGLPEPVVAAATRPEHMSGWESVAEIAEAATAGLGQAQQAESVGQRQTPSVPTSKKTGPYCIVAGNQVKCPGV